MATGDKPEQFQALMICHVTYTPNADPGREHRAAHEWWRPVTLWSKAAKARVGESREFMQCPDHDGMGGGDGPKQTPRA